MLGLDTGWAETGRQQEGRTSFLADPATSALDAANENSLKYTRSRPLPLSKEKCIWPTSCFLNLPSIRYQEDFG